MQKKEVIINMTNQLEHRFSIKRVTKTSDEDYIKALRIYNDTTPFEIKTSTNEITFWLSKHHFYNIFFRYIQIPNYSHILVLSDHQTLKLCSTQKWH